MNAGGDAIRAVDVTLQYQRDQPMVLDNLSLCIPAGSMVAVTGPSGCGKSSLLYLLGLLLTPTAGRIFLLGQDVSRWSDAQKAAFRGRYIGFVFQDALLDGRQTVLDNIMEGTVHAWPVAWHGPPNDVLWARTQTLMSRVGLAATALGARPPTAISGGQAQRVALCRALVKQPSLILGDEPTGNLDQTTATQVLNVLRGEADRGASVVLATHDPVVAARADSQITLGLQR